MYGDGHLSASGPSAAQQQQHAWPACVPFVQPDIGFGIGFGLGTDSSAIAARNGCGPTNCPDLCQIGREHNSIGAHSSMTGGKADGVAPNIALGGDLCVTSDGQRQQKGKVMNV